MAILKGEIKITEYLNSKGITIAGKYFSYDKNIDRKSYENQIKLIVSAQKILAGCNFDKLQRFQSTIGKDVENYKVQLKKLRKNYDDLLDKYNKNDVEKLLLSEGNRMLQKGNDAVKYIYDHGYFTIIERSMNREEICIGRVDAGNLRVNKGKIEIGVIKGMAYDLVEQDMYRYIKKLQRKRININEKELIKIFVHLSHLSFNSIYYLRGLCTYPRDFLRTWEKYIENKKNKSIEEYMSMLKNSMQYENKNFIL
ncbi:MAG: spore coat protein [Clostridium butyricum]|nr:spore coat protein [Clostridium butyricum]